MLLFRIPKAGSRSWEEVGNEACATVAWILEGQALFVKETTVVTNTPGPLCTDFQA